MVTARPTIASFLAFIVCSLLWLTPRLAVAASVDKPSCLVIVNGDSITTATFEASFSNIHATMSTREKETFDYRKLLNKLVNDRLLVQEAESMKMDQESSVTKLLEKRRKEYAVAAYIKSSFVPKDSVTDAEVHKFFMANFGKKQLRTVAVETKEKASELMARIRKGADMDSIAQAVSLDMYKYHGGLRSPAYDIALESEFKPIVSKLKVHELAGPVAYRKSFAFVRLEQATPPDTADLPKVKDSIVRDLKTQKQNQSWQAFLTDLRSKSAIVVDSALLSTIRRTQDVALDSTFMKGSSKPVATIASRDTITDFDLRQRIAHLRMAANTQAMDSLARQTLDESINEIVLFRAAETAGFTEKSQVLSKLASTRDSVLIEMYLKETVVSRIKFNHQEFTDYYNAHLEDFREPAEYNLKEIMVNRRDLADSIVGLVHDGADFNFVARKLLAGKSDVDEVDKWMSLGAFPQAIQDDLSELPTGSITKPYQTSDGWVIFKIKERRPGKIKEQSEADMQIRDIMFQQKFDESLDKILNTLKKNSQIVYFDNAINAFLGKTTSK